MIKVTKIKKSNEYLINDQMNKYISKFNLYFHFIYYFLFEMDDTILS